MRKLLLTALVLVACTSRLNVGEVAARDERPAGADPDASDAAVVAADASVFTLDAATTRLAAGTQSTCGITAGRKVLCWGSNASGELGRGPSASEPSVAPMPVLGLADVRSLAGGFRSHCAVLGDGTARCWGASLYGYVGSSSSMTIVPTGEPHANTGLGADVAKIAMGLRFACALTTTGRAKCWGTGGSGQLGTGGTADEILARDVVDTAGEPFVDLALSGTNLFACAVGASGAVYGWGNNDRGQLGTSPGTAKLAPSRVDGLPEPAKACAAGRDHACAILASGRVACWGSDAAAQLGAGFPGATSEARLVAGVAGARSVAAGATHTCVIDTAGEVLCWGANEGSSIDQAPGPKAPTRVANAAFGAVSVATGASHTCVLGSGARVSCRGASDAGQTGTGDFAL